MRACLAIALAACSLLVYEILLTRLASLRFFFHFSFLVVGLGLLGVGAGGAALARWQDRLRGGSFLPRAAGGYALSLLVAFAGLMELPIRQIAFDPGGLAHLAAYGAFAGLPFLAGGLLIGGLLTRSADRVHSVYAADLLGAGLGCLLCPMALERFGAGGAFALSLALAAGAWGALACGVATRSVALALAGIALLAAPGLDAQIPAPSKLAATPEWSAWSANSRVDVLPAPEPTIYTRGTAVLDAPIPPQRYICQDGAACTFITDFSGDPDALAILEGSLYSAALQLTWRPRVFVIGVGGGNDVWAARLREAERIRGVELNPPILAVHRDVLPAWSQELWMDRRISLEHGEGRSALERDPERYDVVQMSGIDTWAALASGAYMLAENYLYTTEAFAGMLDHLEDGGILQIVRMAAEMETLRLLSTLHAADPTDFADSVAAIGSPDRLVAVLKKRGAFTPAERAELERFVRTSGLTPLYLPGRRLGTAAEAFVTAPDKTAFIRDFPRDISPTTDDRPYFFHFTKWRNPLAAAAHVKEPTHVSQGNPLFLLGHLAASALVAFGLVGWGGRVGQKTRGRGLAGPRGAALIYFSGLGAGFIAIEVALIQALTLLLGQPVYSLAVTLSALLIASGVGSLLSRDWRGIAWVFPAILLGACAFVLAEPAITEAALPLSISRRSLVASALVAPLGVLMGAPFAWGVRRLESTAPELVPWAWAINGCATAVGAVLTAAASMTLGFDAVMLGAGGIYVIAWWAGGRRL